MSIKTVTLQNGTKRYRVRKGYNGPSKTFDKHSDAKAFLKGIKPKKLYNRPSMGTAWQGYIVPAPLLRQLIDKHKHTLIPTDGYEIPDEFGWKTYLAERIAAIKGMNTEAVLRRIYDIDYNKTKVIQADFADAVCLALGLFIDHDTNIPTLPGNKHTALEMVEAVCESSGITLDTQTMKEYAYKTYRVGLLAIAYPHKADRIVKLAPLGCLGGAE